MIQLVVIDKSKPNYLIKIYHKLILLISNIKIINLFHKINFKLQNKNKQILIINNLYFLIQNKKAIIFYQNIIN